MDTTYKHRRTITFPDGVEEVSFTRCTVNREIGRYTPCPSCTPVGYSLYGARHRAECVVDGCDGGNSDPPYAYGICGPCLRALAESYDAGI